MNKKSLILIIMLTLLFSFGIYGMYKNKNDKKEIYLLQVGAYKSYDNLVKSTRVLENYTIIEEDDLYKVFIGVTLNDEVYDKLKSIYASELSSYKKVMKIDNESLEKKINKYDELILKLESKNEIDLVIKEELKMFKESI